MAVPEVNKKLLEELEDMGFPRARATRALHYSGAYFFFMRCVCVGVCDFDGRFPNLVLM